MTTSFNNVVLATGNASSGTNLLTIANNLALENSQNVMVGAEGTAGLGTSNQSIKITGGISNGTATSASLTLLFGGGTPNNYGASFAFTRANSYTGNLTIGNTLRGTQGATGSFTPASFP